MPHATFAFSPPRLSPNSNPENIHLVTHTEHAILLAAYGTRRWQQYCCTKASIEAGAGSLEAFAGGYKQFGINREGAATVYREWAPVGARRGRGRGRGWRRARPKSLLVAQVLDYDTCDQERFRCIL